MNIRNFIALFSSLFISLIIGEIILRQIPVEDPYIMEKYPIKKNGYIRSQFPPNVDWEFSTEEGLIGFDNKKTKFTTNSLGYRGRELKEDEYRIFAIGGSTTECLYIDDNDQWPRLLEEKLNSNGHRTNVQNAGKSGDAIDDHIAMVAHKIVHLEPDMLLFYMGINDVLRLVCNDNPLKYDKPGNKIPVFKHVLSEFQLYRRLHNIISKNNYKHDIAFESDYAVKTAYVNSFPQSDSIPEIDTSFFIKKLEVLIKICEALPNTKVVFVPQLSTWGANSDELKKWHWLTEICGIRYKPDVLAGVMDQVNKMIIDACEKKDIPVINSHMIISAEYFYDDCHFNPAGSKAFAEAIFKEVDQLVKNSAEEDFFNENTAHNPNL